MKFIFVISFVIQIFSLVVNSLTESDVVKIQNDIKSMFKLGPAYGDPCNGKLQPCPKGDSIG